MISSTQPHDDEELPYMKQDMVEEILVKLPPKSIIRFKSVSKSFNNLISGTRFCNAHLKQALERNSVQLMNLENCNTNLLISGITGRGVWDYDEGSCRHSFLAQCNGLFCNGDDDDIFLTNLSTRQSRKLPTNQIQFPTDHLEALVFFGLGYHAAADDYKLVRVAMFNGVDFKTEVKVFSRNTGIWKRIDDFPYKYPFGKPGVYANGRIHWVVYTCEDDDEERSHMVAALDLKDDSYSLIRIPHFESTTASIKIESLADKLAVFQTPTNHIAKIWILTNEPGAQSWTRITIRSDCPSTFDACYYFRPLCLSKAGEILIRVGPKKVMRFDVAKRRFYDDHTPSLDLDCKVISYVESIISAYGP